MSLMQSQADIPGCSPRQANLAAGYLLLNQSHTFQPCYVSLADIDGLEGVLSSDLRDSLALALVLLSPHPLATLGGL